MRARVPTEPATTIENYHIQKEPLIKTVTEKALKQARTLFQTPVHDREL